MDEETWAKTNRMARLPGGITYYYGAKQLLKANDPKARRLPLYEYFLPYLSYSYPRHSKRGIGKQADKS